MFIRKIVFLNTFLLILGLQGCAVHPVSPYPPTVERSSAVAALYKVQQAIAPAAEIRDDVLFNTPKGAILQPGEFENSADVGVDAETGKPFGVLRIKGKRKGKVP